MNQSLLLPEPVPDFGDNLDFWETPRTAYEPIIPILREAVGDRRVQVLEPHCLPIEEQPSLFGRAG